MRRVVVGIVGPTATGKTAVGMELAKTLGGEIISADSMAVYRGMDIGTAKPSPEDRAAVPFHLLDVVGPDQGFNAAEFKRLAEEAIQGIESRGKQPILVGGTGFYVKALTGSLNIPAVAANKALRAALQAEAQESDGEVLLEKLREVDPATAGRLHPNDLKRIIRALEVFDATGKPMSQLHAESGEVGAKRPVVLFGLNMSRPVLYERIERRIDEMMAAGLLTEVESLLAQGYSRDLPSVKGLGYKQLAGYIEGECDLPAAVEQLKRDTRRFAKRQLTWFRAVPDVHWVDVEGRSAPEVAALICSYDVLSLK